MNTYETGDHTIRIVSDDQRLTVTVGDQTLKVTVDEALTLYGLLDDWDIDREFAANPDDDLDDLDADDFREEDDDSFLEDDDTKEEPF